MTRINTDEEDADLTPCSAGEHASEHLKYESRKSELGAGLIIRRSLPLRRRRMIGAWCFLDHFGPMSVEDRRKAMWVGPHPHIGLQTVTWLLEGEVLHRDSIGSNQIIRPGQLNVMTSGQGISHTEETPEEHSEHLHGVQFWVALPEADRNGPARFEHHPQVPHVEIADANATVFFGRGLGVESPAATFSDMVGIDIELGDAAIVLERESDWEYGIVSLTESIEIDGEPLEVGELLYVSPGTGDPRLSGPSGARIIVVGGLPFDEKILLWWNFVARSHDEIVEARRQWEAGERFGEVEGFEGSPLEAPEIGGRLG